MQKGFGFWILLLVFGTALLCVYVSSNPGDNLVHHKKTSEFLKTNRKLKEYIQDEYGDGNIDIHDYMPSDPAPSSKAASTKHGPIEHGTPLIPYLPNPAPPSPGPNDP
ncbi:uncharacterized protein [Rutidosis leptorrhynchoides]|uniref:uncharacterized protein n=1 Tax=Rutidosis leptorrhynchoides TaxID=125765 RepID=UPI003A9A2061